MSIDNERQPLLSDQNAFDVTADTLSRLVETKDKEELTALGGVQGICRHLKVDPTLGLCPDEGMASSSDKPFAKRKAVFGENLLPRVPPKTFLQLLWSAYNDKTLFMLTIAACISLGIGVWKDANDQTDDPKVGWVEGTAILVAVVVVVLTNAINDYQRETQFKKLNAKHNQNQYIKVLRGGRLRRLAVQQLCVGDIVDLEPGDVVPFDGLYLHGHELACDESSSTGESNTIKKHASPLDDCYILSGSRVLLGVGRVVVVAVGVHSFLGKTMVLTMTVTPHQEQDLTPLQQKLNTLANQIAWFGMIAAGVIFIVLLVKFLSLATEWPDRYTLALFIVNTAIEAITIIVVAVPEGLPMAVTLALAYATTHLLKENNLVRILAACETMGNATTICSDKTGTMTKNKMTVVQGTFGNASFNVSVDDDDNDNDSPTIPITTTYLTDLMRQLVKEGVAINSTAYIDDCGHYTGSTTECALLEMVKQWQDLDSIEDYRQHAVVEKVYPFSSQDKSMTVIIRSNDKYRLHTKGAPEGLLDHCTHYMDGNGHAHQLERAVWDGIIKNYAEQALRTMAVAYRDMTVETYNEKIKMDGAPLDNLVLLGVVGIRDPLRPGVVDSVVAFRRAGVSVRMITGDNIYTAKAIATTAGILTTDGLALTGPEFRQMDTVKQRNTVGQVQVLARSTPHDKMTMVARLQEIGEIVAMTGDGTNDGPALKLANIGFSMNLAGSEVAKEASDIILMDDNFNSILKALLWGRSINDGIRKFLTFQLTVNVAAVALALISAIFSKRSESILGAVQLLWINLIMDTLAALALATEPPNDTLLDRPPIPKTDHIINGVMAYRILSQALFQVLVTLVVMYGSPYWFGLDQNNIHDYLLVRTMVFNTFVSLQFFNAINCRRVHEATTLNVFDHLAQDWLFLTIQTVIALGQILIVAFAGSAFKTTPLSLTQWILTACIGFGSVPVGWFFTLLARIPLLHRLGCVIWRGAIG